MAGLGRRTFAAGEVLTASNVMGYLQDQAVMNFAGTAARGSAVPTPSEGMVSYLADSNVVQAYDGSAWNSLAYASSVFTPAMIPVVPTSVDKSGGSASANSKGYVTFSGVSSVSLNGVFTSTYDYYKIFFSYESSTNASNGIRLRVSGADNTTSNYVVGRTYQDDNTGGFQNTGGQTAWGTTPTASVRQYNAELTFVTPYGAVPTQGWHIGTEAASSGSGAKMAAQSGGMLFQASTSFDGLTLYPSTGTITGTIQVFGFNK